MSRIGIFGGPSGTRIRRVAWLLVWPLFLLSPHRVCADGGAVQFAQRSGDCQITVMTDPTPLKVGIIDVSVMVQDAGNGSLIHDGRVIVSMRHLDGPSILIRAEATAAAATNKLLRSAQIELPHPGRWELTIELSELAAPATITTTVHVADRSSRWREALGWILAPSLAIGLYAVGELLATRERRARGRKILASASGKV